MTWSAKPYTVCSCYFSDLLSSHSLCSSHAGHLTVHPAGRGSHLQAFSLLSFHQAKFFAQRAIQVIPSFPSGFITQMPALTTLPHSGTPLNVCVCVCVWVCVHAVTQSCLTLLRPHLAHQASPWDFSGKNTGVGCCFLLQGIFLAQGSNLHLLWFLHW